MPEAMFQRTCGALTCSLANVPFPNTGAWNSVRPWPSMILNVVALHILIYTCKQIEQTWHAMGL